MQKNKQKLIRKKDYNIFFKYIPCFFTGVLIMILGILAVSIMYYKSASEFNYLYFITYIFIIAGAFFTGNLTHKKLGGRGFISGFLGSVPLIIFDLILITVFSFKELNAFILIIIPICALSGAIGGIVASNAKKRY